MISYDNFGLNVQLYPKWHLSYFRDKTSFFRKRNIVESALYVKKKWGTIYGVSGMRYDRLSEVAKILNI